MAPEDFDKFDHGGTSIRKCKMDVWRVENVVKFWTANLNPSWTEICWFFPRIIFVQLLNTSLTITDIIFQEGAKKKPVIMVAGAWRNFFLWAGRRAYFWHSECEQRRRWDIWRNRSVGWVCCKLGKSYPEWWGMIVAIAPSFQMWSSCCRNVRYRLQFDHVVERPSALGSIEWGTIPLMRLAFQQAKWQVP